MDKTFDLGGRAVRRPEKLEPSHSGTTSSNTRKWSEQQLAVFDWCERGGGNLVVTARAGTGKTTTIVEAAKKLPGRVLLCAFNKRIAEELKQRVAGTTIDVSTLHALGLKLWRRHVPNVQVDANRGLRLAEAALKSLGYPVVREYTRAVKDLAGQAKGIVPSASQTRELDPIGWNFGAFDGLTPKEIDMVLKAALRAMQLAVETQDGAVDYDDMLYLPLRRPATHGEYDFVIVDEAQDMNRAQLELARQVMKRKEGLIVVGDDRQAIYGFRGADSGSLARLARETQADRLSLTVTYRCPKKVVQFANFWVPDLQAAPAAPDGELRALTEAALLREAEPGDFIISRLNAPLLPLCLALVAAGKRAKVEGRDVGRQLTTIIDKLKPASTEDLISRMEDWLRKQVAHAGDDEAAAQAAMDVHDAVCFLARETGDLARLRSLIDFMFEDSTPGVPSPRITLMTAHKSKGLEADRVFVLCKTFKDGFRTYSSGEEGNLKYVAATRAKKVLAFVEPDFDLQAVEQQFAAGKEEP